MTGNTTYYVNWCSPYLRNSAPYETIGEAKRAADEGPAPANRSAICEYRLSQPDRGDACVMDGDGHVAAIRRWHGGSPASSETDPSACLDCGPAGHYGPWEDDAGTIVALAREDDAALDEIMSSLRAGACYGRHKTDLSMPSDGKYIRCHDSNGCAIAPTHEQLRWLITRHFLVRPSTFATYPKTYARKAAGARKARYDARAMA